MKESVVKEYTNGEATILWKPQECIHSGICLRGLPKVFNLKQRPWINMTEATSEEIVTLVRNCPSKALSIKGLRFKEDDKSDHEITLIHGGPLIVKGGATVVNRKKTEVFRETLSFCRCNRSEKFPYCDGTHAQPKEN